MSRSTEIFSELQQISPLVADLTVVSPYQIPAGYFEGLASEILSRIKIKEDDFMFPFPETIEKYPFYIPNGYFERFADTIINRIKAIEATSPKTELEALSPLLGQLERKMPFNIPEGYFLELPLEVLSGVSALEFVNQELEALSPEMIAAKNKNVYEVPKGYFDNLADGLLQKVKSNQKGKLISLPFNKKIFRYAAAAMVAGAFLIGSLFLFQGNSLNNTDAALSEIEKVSDEDILNYLDHNSLVFPENFSLASFDLKEENVKDLLVDIPDEELQQYLDQYAVSKEMKIN